MSNETVLTTWEKVKHHFSGHPEDLVEVIYYDMEPHCWELLFNWLEGKVTLLRFQHGYIKPPELNYDSFINGELCYIATIKSVGGLDIELSIIDDDKLEINIEIGEIQSVDVFEDMLLTVNDIAKVIFSRNYIISPEIKPEHAFVINGNIVES
jgi:hypothetical protein